MADGRIAINVDVNGEQLKILVDDLENVEKKAPKTSNGIKDIAVSLGLVKIASAAFTVLNQSMDAAISRFDTMESFPKVMESIGFETDQSSASVDKLSKGIEGLPTKLNDVVSTTQRMAAMTGDLDKSTDATLALNNAFLASGASSADAARGTDQYIKMLSTGEVNLMSWKTLQETMPVGLQKTAEAMEFTGKTAQQDLYEALKSGEIVFSDFQDQLIELGTGTGELAELAKLNSEGIATSFANLGNSVVKGLANVIKALDDALISISGKNIAQTLDTFKGLINATFDVLIGAIEMATPAIGVFVSIVVSMLGVIEPAIPLILEFAKVLTGLLVIRAVTVAFQNSTLQIRLYSVVTKAAEIASKAYAVAMNILTFALDSHYRALVLSNVAEKAKVALTTIQTALTKAYTTVNKALTASTSAYTIATNLATLATTALKVAISVLLGPVGILISIVTALTVAIFNVVKAHNKETEEIEKLREKQEELIQSTSDLVESNKSEARARKDNLESVKQNRIENEKLIDKLELLTSKEKLSNAEKTEMSEMIEKLNSQMGELNIVYDEQNHKLSEQPSKIREQINAFNDLETASQAQENINEMLEQRNSNEFKLMEINIQRERWNETLENSSGKTKEAKENIEKLNEEERRLQETQIDLASEIRETAIVHEEAMQRASVAVENGVMEQSISYESLQGKNKEVMDSMQDKYRELEKTAKNVFEQIEQKQSLSMEEMINNGENNVKAMEEWANNMDALSERAIDKGIMEHLRSLGPEGAEQTKVFVDASDEELAKLNDVYKKAPEVALDSMKKAYQLEQNGVNEEVAKIIPNQEATLMDSIKEANFEDVGKSMTDGIKTGVENGKKELEQTLDNFNFDASIKKSIEKANFEDVGASIPQGLDLGIEKNSNQPVETAGSLATDVMKQIKKDFDSHSPSKKTEQEGKNLTDGLSAGVEKNKQKPISDVEQLAQKIISSMDILQEAMYNAGLNAMNALANGINNGANAAINAANNVASQISNTVSSASGRTVYGLASTDSSSVFDDATSYRYITEDSSLKVTPSAESFIYTRGRANNMFTVTANHSTKEINPTVNIHIENIQVENDEDIQETSEKLGVLTERQIRGRLF